MTNMLEQIVSVFEGASCNATAPCIMPDLSQDQARYLVQLALQAIRNPTEEMVQDTIKAHPGITVNSAHVQALFQAMIDSALSNKTP